MFNEVIDAIDFLCNIKMKDKKKDISRITTVLNLLGDFHKDLLCIHVAGTNGKGSTTNFISSILKENNLKVGKFISPYVICFNERIQINDCFIPDDILLKYINEMYEIYYDMINNHNLYLTFFEMTFIIALKYFKDSNVDYCVIETGIGGLIDCTNVINKVVSIVTNVSFDHTNSLGNTIEEIAKHKFGIVSDDSHLITIKDEATLNICVDTCNKHNSTYNILDLSDIVINTNITDTSFTYKNNDYKLKQLGQYQAYNAILAIECVNYLFNFSYESIYNGLYKALWPARIEIVKNDPLVIIDGAHNIAGINSLYDFYKLVNIKPIVILGILKDKDYKHILKTVEEFAKEIVFIDFSDPRACTPDILVNECSIKCCVDNNILNNLSNNETYLITGSLHFASYMRKFFKN